MTATPKSVLIVPKSIQRGEIAMISALVKHPMESGFRRTETGALIPANLLRSLEVTLNGRLVFKAELESGLSANPMVSFPLLVREGGTLRAVWRGDAGFEAEAQASLPA